MSFDLYAVSDVDFEAYVDAFNLAYSDYYVPMNLTTERMQALIERESIDLDASLVAVDGEKIVGMGMLAVRDDTGWVGGMGTIPQYRRRGVARHVLNTLIDNAHQLGLSYVDLEVITQNRPAYDLYIETGFQKTRVLAILERPVRVEVEIDIPANFAVFEASVDQVLEYFDVFHDVDNPWQRGYETMQKQARHMSAYAITSEDDQRDVLGYALGNYNAQRLQFWDAAISPDADDRQAVAVALFAQIHAEMPKASGGIINVGDNEIILEPMQSLGYRQVLRQYEMRLTM